MHLLTRLSYDLPDDVFDEAETKPSRSKKTRQAQPNEAAATKKRTQDEAGIEVRSSLLIQRSPCLVLVERMTGYSLMLTSSFLLQNNELNGIKRRQSASGGAAVPNGK